MPLLILTIADQNSPVDNGEDSMMELRRLAVADPQRIIWSNTTETIEVQKSDNRLGCKIIQKKV